MTEVAGVFNKSASLAEGNKRRDVAKLDPDQRNIFQTFSDSLGRADEERRAKEARERPQRIAATATRLVAQQPTLQLGGRRTEPPVKAAEVEALFARAKVHGVDPERVTPLNSRERHIQTAIPIVQKYEQDQAKAHAEERTQNERKLLDNLLTLNPNDDGRPRNGKDKDDGNIR